MRSTEPNRRRQELLRLGLELFGNESFEPISIDAIAARAGVSRGLLYHYFGGKRDYYVATSTRVCPVRPCSRGNSVMRGGT